MKSYIIFFLLCIYSPLLFAKDTKSIKIKVTNSKKTTKTTTAYTQIAEKPTTKIEKLVLNDDTIAKIFKTDVRKDINFLLALDRSIEYFASIQDKSDSFKYGDETYSPKEMLSSLLLFKEISMQDFEYDDFLAEVTRLFDVYTVNNYRSQSIFTGYFTPKLSACLEQDGECQTPLHLKDGGKIFVKSQTDARSAILEGAGILELENGEKKVITYSKTEYVPSYITIQKLLKPASKKSAPKFAQIKKEIKTPRPLFEETEEPMGTISALTPGYSAAMDKRFTPMGSLIYVYNERENGEKPFERFMLVQDVGGAIKGPGRIDIYLGEGKHAEKDTLTLARKGSVLMLVAKKDAIGDTKLARLNILRGDNE